MGIFLRTIMTPGIIPSQRSIQSLPENRIKVYACALYVKAL